MRRIIAFISYNGWLDAIEAKKATHILEISVSPFQLFLALGFFVSFVFSLINIISLLHIKRHAGSRTMYKSASLS